MKGGKRWKQGSDICVFKPSVACKEDPIGFPAGMPNMISRIIPIKEDDDIYFEELLKEHFPKLVSRGFVVVNKKVCRPSFSDSNLEYANTITRSGPCDAIEKEEVQIQRINEKYNDYLERFPDRRDDLLRLKQNQLTKVKESLPFNLITPEYNDTLYDFLKKNRFGMDKAIEVVRGAISAAIELVPDTGPWIIHGDLTIRNILVKENPGATSDFLVFTALADWGRALTLNPNNIESVEEGLVTFLRNQSKKFGPFSSFASIIRYFRGQEVPPQVELQVLKSFHTLLEGIQNETILNSNYSAPILAPVRGWMVYTIIKVLYNYFGTVMPDHFSELLNTTNQEHLIQVVNEKLPKISLVVGNARIPEDYYTARYVEGHDISGYFSYGGKQKTRRKKRKSKKSLKRL